MTMMTMIMIIIMTWVAFDTAARKVPLLRPSNRYETLFRTDRVKTMEIASRKKFTVYRNRQRISSVTARSRARAHRNGDEIEKTRSCTYLKTKNTPSPADGRRKRTDFPGTRRKARRICVFFRNREIF